MFKTEAKTNIVS